MYNVLLLGYECEELVFFIEVTVKTEVKSVWTICIGLNACYNGNDNKI